MKSRISRWLGMYLIFQTGFLHYLTAQNDYFKAPYLGYLAMLYFLGSLVAVFGIYYRQAWGWMVGFFTAISSILIFTWSRTSGLPGQAVEPWLYPYGLVEAATAGLFMLLVLMQPWKRFAANAGQSTMPLWFRYLMPSLAFLGVMSVSYSTYQWDVYARVIGYHHHVGSLQAVCNTPLTSFDELEKRYGLKLVQMNLSMMNSIVDVRLIVVDPDKAQSLLQDQGALLVNQEILVLAPHHHTHWQLRKDKAHIMFFPTLNNTIHSGSVVSLVIGQVRVEPMVIK